ncbi:MAG: hypothetical protein ACKO1O_08925 [Erythrobacter sp.]
MPRTSALLLALLAALFGIGPVQARAPQAAREVNITQGSEPGWIPSEELEAKALAAWQRFYATIEAGDDDAAHAMMSEGFKAQYPLARFRADRTAARKDRGPLIARDRLRLTWTKDSPAALYPGIYLAIDASARFAAVDRFCGYTILHLAPGAQDFAVMRFEETFIDNAAFAEIAAANSPLQALLVWRLTSRSCPNYTPEPLPASLSDGIEYKTVAEARAAVATREGIETKVENGWTIIAHRPSYSVWSFAPEGAPTYPAVIKRWVEPTGKDTSRASIAMICEAEKRACDALFDEMAYRNGFVPVKIGQ